MLWFFLFLLSIALGGFFALLVAIARTPGLSNFFSPEYFYHGLVGHVDSALIVGLYSFLILLWHRVFKKKDHIYTFIPALLGFVLIALPAVFGFGQALWNNYVPTIIHPLFFTGIALFFLSVFLNSIRFLPQAIRNFYLGDTLEAILSTTVINSFILPLNLLFSYFTITEKQSPYEYYEALFWFPGHTHQFVNAGLLISVWLLLLNRRVINLRFINSFLVIFPITYFIAQFFLNPLSEEARAITTWGYAVGIGVPTILYGVISLTSALKEVNFYRAVVVLSVFLYLVGAGMGYMIVGMDTRVPAHYHTVIASLLVGVIAFTFEILRNFNYLKDLSKFAKSIPFFYGFGMLLFTLGLFWAGFFGAPRKTPGTDYIHNFKVYIFMILMGMGSILSVIGGASFVLYVIKTVLGRKNYEEEGRE